MLRGRQNLFGPLIITQTSAVVTIGIQSGSGPTFRPMLVELIFGWVSTRQGTLCCSYRIARPLVALPRCMRPRRLRRPWRDRHPRGEQGDTLSRAEPPDCRLNPSDIVYELGEQNYAHFRETNTRQAVSRGASTESDAALVPSSSLPLSTNNGSVLLGYVSSAFRGTPLSGSRATTSEERARSGRRDPKQEYLFTLLRA
ncbi:hypothetical protein L226DRAFT_354987 [Lentinus tigrinus ALCF2SS1-7]|uniref:uncharacterized protein n=1 Tax=Lentinus tigrinus ALCF2SS1-7 TaxID=1328758 RepID=UPI0011662B18|nr:hypothetical protein L226DRAFT_354987 [Lentinus tigrinus ALCF2SS1-7]